MFLSAGFISVVVFICAFGGALIGMRLSRRLPREHLDDTAKDVVRGGMAVVATMVALVLGLLIASAKGNFDTQTNEITQLSSDVILLDRMLAHYGPEASPARANLRADVSRMIDLLWSPQAATVAPGTAQARGGERLYDEVQVLAPKNDEQRAVKTQALNLMIEIARMRFLMYEQRQAHVPAALIFALAVWLTLVSLSSGLFARSNIMVVATYFASALSVASAVWLIMEMYAPYSGFIRISDAPMRAALAQLGS